MANVVDTKLYDILGVSPHRGGTALLPAEEGQAALRQEGQKRSVGIRGVTGQRADEAALETSRPWLTWN